MKWHEKSLTELAKVLQTKEVSSTELTHYFLKYIVPLFAFSNQNFFLKFFAKNSFWPKLFPKMEPNVL